MNRFNRWTAMLLTAVLLLGGGIVEIPLAYAVTNANQSVAPQLKAARVMLEESRSTFPTPSLTTQEARQIKNVRRAFSLDRFVLTSGAPSITVSSELQEQIHYGEDGVSVTTGNYSRTFNDLSVESPGFTIQISRTYNSKDEQSGSRFGRGWTFGFEGSLKDGESNLKVAKLPNGGIQAFAQQSDGTYVANDSRSKLEKQPDNSFILTTSDQYTYGFSPLGWIVWMKDRSGNQITIDVDADGRVKKITDAVERKFLVGYNLSGQIASVTDPLGRSVKYEYNLTNKLVRVVGPDNKVIASYEYDAAGYLSKIKDSEQNETESITYHHAVGPDARKVIRHVDSNGNIDNYTYDTDNQKTTITSSGGQVIVKWYDSAFYITKSQDPEGKLTLVEYNMDARGFNAYGETQSIVDRNGNRWEYVRDEKGNILEVINPDGSSSEYAYDDKNNLISEKDEVDRLTVYLYDNTQTNLIKKLQLLNNQKADSPDDYAITEYLYYSESELKQQGTKAKGLLKREIDPEGNARTYTYDKYGYIAGVTDPDGNTTRKYYNVIGWLQVIISPMGHRIDHEYDDYGRLLRRVGDAGDTTRMVYDGEGRLIQEIAPNLYTPESDGLNAATPNAVYLDPNSGTRMSYYPGGKLRQKTDAENNTTNYSYDTSGNLIEQTEPNGSIRQYQYDMMDRIKNESFKASAGAAPVLLSQYQYIINKDGTQRESVIRYLNDTETARTVRTLDYADRILKTEEPAGGVTLTTYYPDGNVESVTNANGNTTYYKYNALGLEIDRWTPASTGRYSHEGKLYDKSGRVIEERVGKDQVGLYQISAVERLIKKNYVYDPNGRIIVSKDSSNAKTVNRYSDDGYLIAESVYYAEDTAHVTEYVNDAYGRPLQVKLHVKAEDLDEPAAEGNAPIALTTTQAYDANGNLIRVVTPKGHVTTYEYDNLNRQLSVAKQGTDEEGQSVLVKTFKTYDWEGNVLTETDERGKTTTNQYDARGLLIRQIDANGKTSLSEYDRAERKILHISPLNYAVNRHTSELNRTVFIYDEADRLKLQIERFQERVLNPATGLFSTVWTERVSRALQYDLVGNVLKELDGEGYLAGTGATTDEKISRGYGVTYKYHGNNLIAEKLDPVSHERKLKFSEKYEYDGAGRKTAQVAADGVVTVFSYDDGGRLLQEKLRLPNTDTERVIRTVSYDRAGHLAAETDGNGNVVRYEQNAWGKVRTILYPSDLSIENNRVIHRYDRDGNLALTKDTTGRTDVYTYDYEGREMTHTVSDGQRSQQVTTATRYDVAGNKRFDIDANSNQTEYSYDGLNRLTSQKVSVTSEGQTKSKTTTYEYDDNGNKLKELDWRGNATFYAYDPINRLYQITNASGVVVEKLGYNYNNQQILSLDALNQGVKFEYDRNNRKVATTDAEGNTRREGYNNKGLVEVVTDAGGNRTQYEYDGQNRLIAAVNAIGEQTSYSYDATGNMVSQTDGNGSVHRFEYNVRNDLLRRIDPGGLEVDASGLQSYKLDKLESYTYYPDGKMKSKTDRNGNVTSYRYDYRGLLLSESILRPGEATPQKNHIVSYTYDNNGNELTMSDGSGQTSRRYDEQNRIVSQSVPGIGITAYTYDMTSGLSVGYVAERMTDVKGNVTDKVYDQLERLTEVRANNNVVAQYSYLGNGNRSAVISPGGVRADYTYYKNNLLKTLRNSKQSTTTTLYEYTYDKAGNQLTKKETIQGNVGITNYTYDRLNRLQLVQEPGGKKTEFTFDRAGNRLSESVKQSGSFLLTLYKYNSQNRMISTEKAEPNGKITRIFYTYDNNGNMVGRSTETNKLLQPMEAPEPTFGLFIPGQPNFNPRIDDIVSSTASYTYDGWNQLIASLGAGNVTYQYNGEGQRIEKTSNGQTTRYVYDDDKVVLELDGQSRQVAQNVYGPQLVTRKTDAGQVYYGYNGHGDVTSLTDASGIVRTMYNYDAFGNPIATATKYYDTAGNPTTGTGKIDSPIRYAGYQYDQETGLYYLNARYYDSSIGRFLSEDSYRGDPKDPLSLNLYTYVNNNPITYDDPTGHFINLVAAAVGAVVGGVTSAAIEMGKDALKGNLSASNWKTYAGAAAEGAITGATAGLSGGTSLIIQAGVRAGASYAGSAAKQKITTGKVDHKKAAADAVMGAAGGKSGGGKPTNKVTSSGGSSKKPAPSKPEAKKAPAKKQETKKAQTSSGNKKTDKSKQHGSYTIEFESGKKYHGKGSKSRMEESAKEKTKKYNDPVKSKDWKPSTSERQSFKDEHKRLSKDGGHKSDSNYNRRASPGGKYIEQDKKKKK